jgi:hypothetical protein
MLSLAAGPVNARKPAYIARRLGSDEHAVVIRQADAPGGIRV